MSVELIRSALAGPVADLGLIVEDLAVARAGHRQVVRLAVDRDLDALALADDRTPVPPLSLDEVADATRVVSDALDRLDALGEAPYVLEVSSPGVDRPLTQPRHLRRNVGRLVVLTPTDGEPVTGRILAVGAGQVLLDTERGDVTFGVDRVRSARVQVEFGRPDDPADAESGESGEAR